MTRRNSVSATMCVALMALFVWTPLVVGAGGPLLESVETEQIPRAWPHLANEGVAFPMTMRDVAAKIGSERQLFLDNCLIAEGQRVAELDCLSDGRIFIQTAPAFRRQGIATRLFRAFTDRNGPISIRKREQVSPDAVPLLDRMMAEDRIKLA